MNHVTCCADQFDAPHDQLHHYFAPHGVVRAHQVQLLEIGDLVHETRSPNLIVLPMLTNLIPRMTYFITTLHLMTVSVLTMINFLKLRNLFMSLI